MTDQYEETLLMQMTLQDKFWHARYESMGDAEACMIQGAFDAAIKVLKYNGYKTAMDDRAEQLIAALTRYIITSKE